MSQKIIKVGSSAAITISKGLLGKFGFGVGDKVELKESSDQKQIIIHPVRDESSRRDRISKLTTEFIDNYRSDLEALAEK